MQRLEEEFPTHNPLLPLKSNPLSAKVPALLKLEVRYYSIFFFYLILRNVERTMLFIYFFIAEIVLMKLKVWYHWTVLYIKHSTVFYLTRTLTLSFTLLSVYLFFRDKLSLTVYLFIYSLLYYLEKTFSHYLSVYLFSPFLCVLETSFPSLVFII